MQQEDSGIGTLVYGLFAPSDTGKWGGGGGGGGGGDLVKVTQQCTCTPF